MVGSVIHGLVGVGSLRKQVKQAMRSKPVSSTLPWPVL
ncbi:rCG25105 [Rattus norvegicus]|uniref:RCG25105 n=1 Tax=Rattus norvegicus TaxID=10116 RepID=A6I1Q6_RAT|nr:rCG25105 [Rattus norvegicus]